MAEPSLEGFGDRAGLRRALAERLRAVRPELRIVADGFLGEESVMDGLAVGGDGELVSIRFAKPSDDRATLTRALADLTWLRARRTDLLKLAPGLGIDPSAEPRAMVFCRGFSAESCAAVDNLPDLTVELWHCRGVGHPPAQRMLVIERVETGSAVPNDRPPQPRHPHLPGPPLAPSPPSAVERPTSTPRPSALRPGPPDQTERPPAMRSPVDPPSGSAFRTGLCNRDLKPLRSAARPETEGPEAGLTAPTGANAAPETGPRLAVGSDARHAGVPCPPAHSPRA